MMSTRPAIGTGPANRPARTSTVERAFAILELVADECRPLSLSEMATRLGLPKPTAHRIAARLEQEGFLIREPDRKRFVVGPRFSRLSAGALAASIHHAPRRAALEMLARETGETCNIGVLDGNTVLYLDRVESRWPLRVDLKIGSRLPLHATAMGKLFLSQMPRRMRRRIYEAGPLEALTEMTITDPEHLERELSRIREDGVSINDQGYLAGIIGIAVAIPGPSSRPRVNAALAVQTLVARVPVQEIRKFVPAMRDAADRLSKALFDNP